MSKSRMPVYLGAAAAAAGGYYLYSAGGNPKQAKEKAKFDVEKARSKLPRGEEAERAGESVGEQASAHIDEILQTARDKARQANGSIGDYAKDSMDKIDQIRHDTAKNMGTSIDKLDRKVEEKAADAKKSISGWFGSSK